MWKKQIGLVCSCLFFAVTAQANIAQQNHVAQGLAPLSGQSIEVLQPFTEDVRILGLKNYHDDIQAKFSPVDFAVSWGVFAEPEIASVIHVQQYDRYLKWSIPYLPVPAEQAIQMVSNIHIIPANPDIAAQLKDVTRGDYVRLKGDLVEIKDHDLVWRSSLSKDDVGDGACEVLMVKAIEWLEPKGNALS